MRQGQHKNRSRGRGRRQGGGGNSANRVYESNGPDVKVRGTAQTVADKYTQLARDAQASGDSVMAESYLQFAEHYFRIVSATQSAQQQQAANKRETVAEEPAETGTAAEETQEAVVETPAKSVDPATEAQPDVVAADGTESEWGDAPQFLKRPVESAPATKPRRTRTPRPKKAAKETAAETSDEGGLNGSAAAETDAAKEVAPKVQPSDIAAATEPAESVVVES